MLDANKRFAEKLGIPIKDHKKIEERRQNRKKVYVVFDGPHYPLEGNYVDGYIIDVIRHSQLEKYKKEHEDEKYEYIEFILENKKK